MSEKKKDLADLVDASHIMNTAILEMAAGPAKFVSSLAVTATADEVRAATYFLYYHLLYEAKRAELVATGLLGPEMVAKVKEVIDEEMVVFQNQLVKLQEQLKTSGMAPISSSGKVPPKSDLN